MANCSKCTQKTIIEVGKIAVEFDCPYGVSVVDNEAYIEDFSDKECSYYKE